MLPQFMPHRSERAAPSSWPGPLPGLDGARLAAFAPPAGAQPPGPRVESAADGTVEGLVTTADGRAVVGARVGLDGMAEPPEVLNVSLRGRFESSRFDDDQNRLRLASLFVADVTVDRPFGDSWGAFLSVENLFDRRYPVQATPVELLGTPLTATAGLRFDLRRH